MITLKELIIIKINIINNLGKTMFIYLYYIHIYIHIHSVYK